MTTRFHIVAAVLGLAVATAAIGDASAKSAVHKTATIQKATIHKTAIARAAHRVIVGKRIVKHVRVARRAPVIVKMVRPAIPATAVRLVKRPLLHKQVFAHRVTVRKTIIR